MIVVTGASGQLGRLVVEELLKTVDAEEIVAAVRTPEKMGDFAKRGVRVREADYSRPETLASAFQGGTRLLLISGNELGTREEQHRAVIEAAKAAGVKFVAYTSALHSDSNPIELAREHVTTENELKASGLSYCLLRNGWYFENQTAAVPSAIEQGAFIGSSGDGKIAAASRADYAAAAATVLTKPGFDNTVLELAGDVPYTRAELAAEVSKQSGKTVVYKDLPEAEYEKILSSFLPPELAHAIADAEAQAVHGALDDTSHTLNSLIGRPTTSLADAVEAALKAPPSSH